jgi:hypothetical protein
MLLLIQSPDNLGHIPSASPEAALLSNPPCAETYCYQPFVYENLANGLVFSSQNTYMVADDFTSTYGGFIERIEIWAIYVSGNAAGFNIQIRQDTGGAGPGSVLKSTVSASVSHTNTGYSQWGYYLWHTEIENWGDLNFGGGKYWFAMQTTGGFSAHYWLCANQTWADMSYLSNNNGTSWTSSQDAFGAPYEQFLILTGALPLERDSWGAIKVLF